MSKLFFLIFCFAIVFVSYSNGKGSSKKPDYARALNQAICRLNSYPDNQRAKKKVQDTYTQALDYYQHEIDRILMSEDSFKWTKTLGVLEEINDLSDEIRYNSTASQLICEPKIYTSEITDAIQKSAAELYEAGIICLKQQSKEKAKEAYSYFFQVAKLNSEYKDVDKQIQEAKSLATLKVIIEDITAYTQNQVVGFSTELFYKALFYRLDEEFTSKNFIRFYTPDEAQKQNIDNPDQIIQIQISDFEIGSRNLNSMPGGSAKHSKELKIVDGRYVWVDIERATEYGSTSHHVHVTSQLVMKGKVFLKINDYTENEAIYKYRMPWIYTEEISASSYSGISPTFISINPDNQTFFDHFSLSACDQLVYRLFDFFGQYK